VSWQSEQLRMHARMSSVIVCCVMFVPSRNDPLSRCPPLVEHSTTRSTRGM
jgi:hypothetical protein